MPRILFSPDTLSNAQNEDPVVGTPQTQPEHYQDITTKTPESFGGVGVGQAEQKAGSDIEAGATQMWDNALKMQSIVNDTTADNGKQQYVDGVNNIWYVGDATHPPLMSLSGDAYLKALPEAQAARAALFNQIANNMNPAARSRFMDKSDRYASQHEDQMFQKGKEATLVSQKASNEAALASSTTNASLNYNNDVMAREDISGTIKALDDEWKGAMGTDPPESINKLHEQTAFTINTTTRVNAAILAGNNAEATRIMKDFGSWGDANKLEPVAKKLEQAIHDAFADKLMKGEIPPGAVGEGAVPGGASGSYNYLISKGASVNEAALLTSGANNESSFRFGLSHDKGIGYGLFGHNGSRLAAMRQEAGTQTPSWQPQLDFALKELRGRPEGAKVNAAKTAEELTDLQMDYEQPKGYIAGDVQHNRTIGNYGGRLAATREYMTHPPTAAPATPAPAAEAPAVTPAPATTTAAPFTGKPLAGGDSIAQQQIDLGVIDGDKGPDHNDPTNTKNATAIGRPISGTLAYYTSLLKSKPDAVRGRTVYLSSGASNTFADGYNNDPAQLKGVEDTINLIKKQGGRVTLFGVGNRFDGTNLNDDLSALAQRTGSAFGGHLIGTEKDSMKIHPDTAATRRQLNDATVTYFDIKTRDDLTAAVKAGKISDAAAEKIIKNRGWNPEQS